MNMALLQEEAKMQLSRSQPGHKIKYVKSLSREAYVIPFYCISLAHHHALRNMCFWIVGIDKYFHRVLANRGNVSVVLVTTEKKTLLCLIHDRIIVFLLFLCEGHAEVLGLVASHEVKVCFHPRNINRSLALPYLPASATSCPPPFSCRYLKFRIMVLLQTRSQSLVDWRMCHFDVSFKLCLGESALHTFLIETCKQQNPDMFLYRGEVGVRDAQSPLPESYSIYPKGAVNWGGRLQMHTLNLILHLHHNNGNSDLF